MPTIEKGIHRGLFLHLYEPPESQNSRFFNLRYIDRNKEDDGYMWYAPFRRIRRINVGQRTDTIDGTDMIYDDEYGWDGHTHAQHLPAHRAGRTFSAHARLILPSSSGRRVRRVPNNLSRERLSTYVVEVKSKDPNYIYSKRVWYVDPETYLGHVGGNV